MADRPVVLITGASRGIGASAAGEFAKRGYDVAITGRSLDSLNATAEIVRDRGAQPLALAGDLADMAHVESLVPEVMKRFGRLDALVNNAAWRELHTMRNITLESWDRTMRVCVTAPAFLTKWAAEVMEPRRKGVVVNVSSIQSERVSGYGPAYMAAKGALDTLTYDLAVLYGPRGIRVVGLNPGAIDTELSNDTKSADGETLDKKARDLSYDMIPLKRWGTADEIAKAIAWLASDDASYITGTTIVADGGWTHQLFPYSFKKLIYPTEF